MATLFQRPGSPYWYVWLKDPRAEGGLVKKSTRETSKTAALRRAKSLQDELDLQVEADLEDRTTKCGLTFLDALALFLEQSDLSASTKYSYSKQGRIITQILGDFDLGQLTHDDLTRFVRERRQMTVRPPGASDTGRRVSDSRIRKDLSTISATYKHVIDTDVVSVTNPVATFSRSKLKTSRVQDRHLRPNQFEEALGACKTPTHRAMLITLVGTGMRSGELMQLYWGEVDFAHEYIEFGNIDPDRTKTKRSRRIPMLKVVIDELTAHKEAQIKAGEYDRNGLVFPGWEKDEHGQKVQRVRYDLKYLIKIVRARTGVKGYWNHGLRHTFASWALQQGMDPNAIRKVLGHTTLSTTQRYAHHVDDSIAGQMKQVKLPI